MHLKQSETIYIQCSSLELVTLELFTLHDGMNGSGSLLAL